MPDEKDVVSNSYRCYTCNKTGHLRKDCPDHDKNSNLNLNFMVIPPLTENLLTSYDLKSHWILDSGATEHICGSASLISMGSLATLPSPEKLTVGNGQILQAVQSGSVYFNDVSLSGVLLCEQCPVNIISEGKLLEKGLSINKSSKHGCMIKKGKKVIMTAKLQNKLLFVDQALLSSELADIRRFR